ncbi:hypothetical protein E8E13_005862 [Curvularia kusanoi]|uniref:DUF1772-domain-containing protein n=1 Tax=Curvularia kusanoi TaxID=90978 RepID=A0A9P4TFP2_CURKU|nr:hypothetical protein E8E13_005862 [Curvularia kusanoi]
MSTHTIQILTISTALFTSGGIAALSAFNIPQLRSQPASRSLPMLRWLFSRGSHTAPTGILFSSAGFAYLAYASVGPAKVSSSSRSSLTQLAHHLTHNTTPSLFLTASLLTLSAALFTRIMLPTNFELIERNEQLGGAVSKESARYRAETGAGPRSAEESVAMKRDVSQWTDVSDPQEKTGREAQGAGEEERVKVLLSRFERLNYVRAGLVGVGGLVGLVAALG